MKKTLLILALISTIFYSNAQSFSLELDHSTILVKDLENSVKFYKNILQLKEIETPYGENAPIRFFEIGNNQQLHVAQNENDGIKLNKIIHIAFATQNFDDYLSFLDDKDIKYSNFNGEDKIIQTRPDGIRQIYFQDPDGYWIEINDAKH